MKIQDLSARLGGLAVFRGLLEDPVIAAYAHFVQALADGAGRGAVCQAAGQFEALLFGADTDDFSEYLTAAVLECENICARRAARGALSPALEKALDSELHFLEELSGLGLDQLLLAAGLTPAQREELAFLPRWTAHPTGLAASYEARLSEMGRLGYGMFARHHVFTLNEEGRLTPVRHPDPQRLADLPGYEREREKILANTKALLAGLPANNVLLYGDAGTGKSSAVKAIVNEYAPEGLRLVEVKKNQLYLLPDLMDQLAANPLKFILFIDDLSFASNDDNFAALKAILEGSAGGRAANIAVYATSNRRHLVKETMTDRTGDDIHEADTRQEMMSLSARFGLVVTFQRPDKALYSQILLELARQYQLTIPEQQLVTMGEAFAIRAGGRSPRAAKQFIEQCRAGVV
ncbi:MULTISPECIES: ATP-binding protein [unclassified Faecalibacterium]|uniref:ATP-binding protein n=1 Tax=unclassified Faecalibacterium TaxID=2646395 RepID=UPI000B37AD85|nr:MULTISPECIES: ATP-binding protein [unclassified Faecalibacterium]OUN38863.1 AAA family ATPase [Faecalibacterium sp. An77]OUQ37150.1 AAA family ATPase [Faecalibacterium sp. An122]